jgi:putative nucleotidyltransferase with HDIG domain
VKAALDVLRALGRTVSTFGTYAAGHPARARALEGLHDELSLLQEESPRPVFSFVDGEIVFGVLPLRGLGEWPWAERFARVGVQRIEFVGPVDRADLEQFVDDLSNRLQKGHAETSEARVTRPTAIRYGLVFRDAETGAGAGIHDDGAPLRSIDLRAEADALGWIESELRSGARLHLAEAETVVSTLIQAMYADQAMLLPLSRLKDFDQYTTTHALNVSVLAMALAEELQLSGAKVRGFGISGLLHDLGKIRIPKEILTKPGALTESERAVMHSHTVEGAKLILEHDADLDLAAVVAYEHHRRTDGGGYPAMKVARRCHEASDLVHVCDVYDALRTHRPYRDAWPHERVMAYLAQGAGTEFDAEMVRAFQGMMGRWSEVAGQIVDLNSPPD